MSSCCSDSCACNNIPIADCLVLVDDHNINDWNDLPFSDSLCLAPYQGLDSKTSPPNSQVFYLKIIVILHVIFHLIYRCFAPGNIS